MPRVPRTASLIHNSYLGYSSEQEEASAPRHKRKHARYTQARHVCWFNKQGSSREKHHEEGPLECWRSSSPPQGPRSSGFMRFHVHGRGADGDGALSHVAGGEKSHVAAPRAVDCSRSLPNGWSHARPTIPSPPPTRLARLASLALIDQTQRVAPRDRKSVV